MSHVFRDLEIASLTHALDVTLSDAEPDMTLEQAERYNRLMELPADVYEKFTRMIIVRDFDTPQHPVLEYTGDSEEIEYDVDVDLFLAEMEALAGQVPTLTEQCQTALVEKFNTLKGEQDGTSLSDHDLAFALATVASQHGHSVDPERITGVVNNLRDPNVSLGTREHLNYAIHACVQIDTELTLPPRNEPEPAPTAQDNTFAPSTPKR
jgi:hypothetical protein